MQNVWEIVSSIILAFGGSSVIILGMSNWLGKVWASRILEKEKTNLTKELEDYKLTINKQLEEYKNHLLLNGEKALHVSKVQYDKEFEIYRIIWEKLIECKSNTIELYPVLEDVPTDKEELEEFNKNKWKKFSEGYNDFSKAIDMYAPFYRQDFYNTFVEFRHLCDEQGDIFKTYAFDVKYSQSYAMARDSKITTEERKRVYTEIPAQLKQIISKLQIDIREYLMSLQIIE